MVLFPGAFLRCARVVTLILFLLAAGIATANGVRALVVGGRGGISSALMSLLREKYMGNNHMNGATEGLRCVYVCVSACVRVCVCVCVGGLDSINAI